MIDPVQLSNLPGQSRPAEQPNAAVVSLPPGLEDVREIMRLRGEVIQVKADNVVRIMTEKGEVELRLSPDTPPPREGDTVEIAIQPGRPPRTASLTAEEELPAPAAPPRTAETPVEVAVRPPEDVPETPAPERPANETPVRLEPIEAEEALAFIADPLEIILSVVEELSDFKTEIIAQKIQQDVISQISALIREPAKTAQTLPPLVQTLGPKQPPLPAIFTAIKPAAVLPESPVAPEHFVINDVSFIPPTFSSPQRGEGYGGLVRPEAELTRSWVGGIFYTPPLETILKPETFTSIPQNFQARISAVQLPPPQLFEITEKIIPKLKTLIANPEPLILQNQKAGAITATVIAQTPQKLPVVAFFSPQAPGLPEQASFFILHAPAPDLTPGTIVTLTPQDGRHVTLDSIAPAVMPLSLFTPEPWPLMDEIYELLTQAMPQAAQAFTNTLPSPARPEQLGPAALFFIAAIRGGDLSAWLGDRAADIIRRSGRGGLLSRLTSEGAALNRLGAEPVSQDWRGISLPLYWDNQIHKLALYYKHDPQGDNDNAEGGRQVRFIFDLNLDHMGKVQLDGLFRSRKLDLIVRSEAPFSSPMQMQMRRAYISALEPTEVRGELSFQNKPEQWVTIKAEKQSFGASI